MMEEAKPRKIFRESHQFFAGTRLENAADLPAAIAFSTK